MKRELLGLLRCPACLESFTAPPGEGDRIETATLMCTGCEREYGVRSGLPLLLLRDSHWRETKTEITGEKEFTEEMPIPEHLKRNRFEEKRSREFLSKVEIPRHPVVLDIGGSSGLGAYLFRDCDPRVVIIDIVPDFLKIAEVVVGPPVELSTAAAGMEWLPFRDDAFDIVFCRQALHHSAEPGRSVREMFRVARPGGLVLMLGEPCLSVVDRFRLWRKQRKATRREGRATAGSTAGEPRSRAEEVMEKLPDALFQYLWTDFARDFRAVTCDFRIERAFGSAASVLTPHGIVFESHHRKRRLAGKVLDRIVPAGLGHRGDINVRATKTRPVRREGEVPSFEPVFPDDMPVREIPPEEAEAHIRFFRQCFPDREGDEG